MARFARTMSEPFIVKTGLGGPVSLGKGTGQRWTIDEEGAEVLEEMEHSYANARHPPSTSFPTTPQDDPRLPDEEYDKIRRKEAGATIRGFIGTKPILGETVGSSQTQPEETDGNVGVVAQEERSKSSDRVMAILAQMRQQP